EVAQRFSDPNFDLDNVAGALGMSRRYVQKLLEGTGKSFTEFLAECRLERAFAMLTDPRHLHLAIIDIAFAVGFGDVSHFNRMFRRHFGETPSGVRVASTMRAKPVRLRASKCFQVCASKRTQGVYDGVDAPPGKLGSSRPRAN